MGIRKISEIKSGRIFKYLRRRQAIRVEIKQPLIILDIILILKIILLFWLIYIDCLTLRNMRQTPLQIIKNIKRFLISGKS
mgnify:FL=1